MDRASEKKKYSTSSRDDRDLKHRSRDDKYRDHHHHSRHRSDRESCHRHRHHNWSSSRRDDREGSRELSNDESEGSRDDHERSRKSVKREAYDGGEDREEGTREKSRESEVKRERSYEETESGVDYEAARKKRKERGESEDGIVEREKRPRRRFGDKVKEEDISTNFDNCYPKEVNNSSDIKVKEEVFDEPVAGAATSNGDIHHTGDGAVQESKVKASSISNEPYVAPIHPLPTKVSSISNTYESKGVSITRSHEVPGKSSTDGTSSAAGKSGSLSLDALAKAKLALQKQKELSEKLKKMPLLSKSTGPSTDGSSPSVSREELKVSSTAASRGSMQSSSSVSAVNAASAMPNGTGLASIPGLANAHNIEVVKRAQELAAKMGFHQDPQFAPLINMFPGQMHVDINVTQKPTKAPVLRVDALGREIDEHGNVVNVTKPSNLSTLKVNINKQKKDAFQILKPELEVDTEINPHFDPRMGIDRNKLLRPKRMTFQFVEEGKWSKEAETIKLKNQFGEERAKDIKARQALHAKAKAAPDVNPNLIEVSERIITKEKAKDPIPEIEWWDMPLLPTGSYGDICDGTVTERELKMDKITIYVEHPKPVEPPAEAAPPPPQPLKLTKKEQKKLRTQRRLAREKDRQEMIRQGLIEPPKPKVKMSNLMKVLGSEATQDPTRLEKEIRTAAAEREQAHIDRNIARKLTPAERREKKERKLFDDPNTLETIVSVYRINDLSHKKTRFKVDVNAHENRVTGCCVMTQGINVVVVEGGSKSIKRYGKLMLKRINWAESVEEEEDGDETEEKPANRCVLVWQGSVAKPSFNKFTAREFVTEAAARKFFADAGVAHYWDFSINFSDDLA